MTFKIRRIDYFYTAVDDRPGEAYRLLSALAEEGINLLAFSAFPIGPLKTQLSIFPEDSSRLESEMKRIGLELTGPFPAFLAQGDDRLGTLAEIHEALYRADVNVYSCSGVTDGCGCFGYVIYVKPDQYEVAARALEI